MYTAHYTVLFSKSKIQRKKQNNQKIVGSKVKTTRDSWYKDYKCEGPLLPCKMLCHFLVLCDDKLQ